MNELTDIFLKYKISNEIDYRKHSLIDTKLIKYEYISSGFYNDTRNGFNINNVYYIKNKRR